MTTDTTKPPPRGRHRKQRPDWIRRVLALGRVK